MIDNSELDGLALGISVFPGDRTWLAGGSDDQLPFAENQAIDALAKVAEETQSKGVRLDLTPGLLERLLGSPLPNRPSREWYLSRKELAIVWNAAMQTSPSAIGLSLSHTKGAWLAAARTLNENAAEKTCAYVGVDIEAAGRVVTDRLLKRFSNPNDSCPGLSRIGLWTAKEALYKADPDSRTKALRDYAAVLSREQGGFFTGNGTLPSGRSYAACLSGNGRYILAAAADTSPPVR